MEQNLLYHGTTREFHDMNIDEIGRYQMAHHPIDLDTHLFGAVGYANDRAPKYNASPLLLVVNAEKVRDRLRGDLPQPQIDFLELGEYLPIDIPQIMDMDKVMRFLKQTKKTVETNFGLEDITLVEGML